MHSSLSLLLALSITSWISHCYGPNLGQGQGQGQGQGLGLGLGSGSGFRVRVVHNVLYGATNKVELLVNIFCWSHSRPMVPIDYP